ncbi:dynein regulatory complex protein 8 isoform X3 [Agelaius tricolor]|uniref:dynein regulatory complex protein 8 isoform X3 n=1 Tax=Agelaius tricolor TaxID=9191 RepID=UPI0039F19E37
MAESEEKGEDGLVAEIEKKITEAFEVFDRESNKTVDVREIGCIVRSLGCFPTEAEVQELLEKIEVEEPGGFVHLEHFLPVMTKVLLDRRFRPIPEDVILHAFELLETLHWLWAETEVAGLPPPKCQWASIRARTPGKELGCSSVHLHP